MPKETTVRFQAGEGVGRVEMTRLDVGQLRKQDFFRRAVLGQVRFHFAGRAHVLNGPVGRGDPVGEGFDLARYEFAVAEQVFIVKGETAGQLQLRVRHTNAPPECFDWVGILNKTGCCRFSPKFVAPRDSIPRPPQIASSAALGLKSTSVLILPGTLHRFGDE